MIGVSVGYRFSQDVDWKSHPLQALENNGTFSSSGFFATVRIGGGYRKNKQR
jgi:hypothetical protein